MEKNFILNALVKHLSKSFLYSFFSASGRETRVFPLSEKHHSGKKAGFLPRADIGCKANRNATTYFFKILLKEQGVKRNGQRTGN
ncbi:Uncharacterized protein dnm_052780 [Desulfonema magnum]|uniref:Uncharacterized protein n=1 Tax=Desulfonema magnum TaxID=45655 RepID=A0A975BPF8_9BACT|nr:Uncharacterized protein dnm_052780 [Desulfonema magnum]